LRKHCEAVRAISDFGNWLDCFCVASDIGLSAVLDRASDHRDSGLLLRLRHSARVIPSPMRIIISITGFRQDALFGASQSVWPQMHVAGYVESRKWRAVTPPYLSSIRSCSPGFQFFIAGERVFMARHKSRRTCHCAKIHSLNILRSRIRKSHF
jgi:hypothetical protein